MGLCYGSPVAPRRPRRLTRIPERLEHPQVAQRVHRLPEAAVLEGDELAVRREALEGLALEEDLVPGDPVEDRRLEDEEPGVHPGAIANRLFLERADARRHDASDGRVVLDLQGPEATERLDRGDRRLATLRSMELGLLRE